MEKWKAYLFDGINKPMKTKSASKVLQMMDKDVSYSDAVKKVAKDDNISIKQLEMELESWI